MPSLSILVHMSFFPYRDVAKELLPEGLACSLIVLFHDLE